MSNKAKAYVRLKDSVCPICGKWFHHLGLASHRAACRRKKQEHDLKAAQEIQEIFIKLGRGSYETLPVLFEELAQTVNAWNAMLEENRMENDG